MERKEEKLVLFATSIAMELAKDLSLEQLEELKILIGQIGCSLGSLISMKCSCLKKIKK